MSTISLCSFEMSTPDVDHKGVSEADDCKMDKATSTTGRKIVVAMDGSEHALYALDWYNENLHRDTDYVYLVYSTELHHILHNHKWVYSPQHNDLDTVLPLIKEEQAIVKTKLESFDSRLKNLGGGNWDTLLPKFHLKLPMVKRRETDRYPWLAKMELNWIPYTE